MWIKVTKKQLYLIERDQMSFDELIVAIYGIKEDDELGEFLDELRQFLRQGGDIYQSNPSSGWSLMHIACEKRNHRLIQALAGIDRNLLNINPDCNYPPLFQALDTDIDGAIQNNEKITFEITKLLIELGADTNVKFKSTESLREFAESYGESVVQEFDKIIKPILL